MPPVGCMEGVCRIKPNPHPPASIKSPKRFVQMDNKKVISTELSVRENFPQIHNLMKNYLSRGRCST